MSFKDEFRDFQELIRELFVIRNNNLAIKDEESQEKLLLFSEGALTLMVLERFLRILPDVGAREDDSLANLLEKATSKSRRVLILPQGKPRTEIIEIVTDIRNALLHGNFEQLAKKSGLKTKEEYFKKIFASEVEGFYKIIEYLVDQIDPETGTQKIKK